MTLGQMLLVWGMALLALVGLLALIHRNREDEDDY